MLMFGLLSDQRNSYGENKREYFIFFERTARTKADSTIAKSTTPKVKRGLLKAGSE